MIRRRLTIAAIAGVMGMLGLPHVYADLVGTAFTFQGQLKDGGAPARGPYDFTFTLFDHRGFGEQVGPSIVTEDLDVVDGLFAVELDFGSGIFEGTALWLNAEVRGGDDEGAYTTLTPRQAITTSPYAQYALNTHWAASGDDIHSTNDGRVGIGTEVPASELHVVGKVTLSDSGDPSGDGSAVIQMFDIAGTQTVFITGQSSRDPDPEFGAGLISLYSEGVNTIELDGGTGNVYATGFVGDGSGLTGLPSGFWQEGSSSLVYNGGSVSIGDDPAVPVAALYVASDEPGDTMVLHTNTGLARTLNFSGEGSINAYGIAGFDELYLNDQSSGGVYIADGGGHVHIADGGGNVLLGNGGGEVGIGTTAPQARLHVEGSDIELSISALFGEEVVVEASDAVMGLYSTGGGDWGSAISLGEVDSNGDLVDKWTLARRTSAEDSPLRFNYGSDPNYSNNGALLTLTTDWKVGILHLSPEAPLHVGLGTDTEPGGGGYLVLGVTSDANLSLDTNEIMARSSGAPATLYLNNDGGDVVIAPGSTTRVSVLEITGADLAEKFPTTEVAAPGTVMEIDPDHPGQLRVARGAYNRRVAGVISGANDFQAGAILGSFPGSEDAPAIALTGRVWVRCDTTNGPINIGDLLTTSVNPGQAMRVSDYASALGAIIGKAMTPLAEGESGLVLVLVSLQ